MLGYQVTSETLPSTYSIKSPRFNSKGTKSDLQKGGGVKGLFNSISFYLRRHHTRSFASHLPLPKSTHKLQTAKANFITRGKQYATIDKRKAVVKEGGGSETVIEIRIAARMHNATAKPLHAFGVPEACQQEIRGHRFHQEDFDRIQKRDQGSNEEDVDATPEADYARIKLDTVIGRREIGKGTWIVCAWI